jgi:uncharacterized protein (TIGR04255 family)
MTDARKLMIDHAEQFPRLAHAPIVEAVIDIRARAQDPCEETVLLQCLKPRLPDYPITNKWHEMEGSIRFGPDQPQIGSRDLGWAGFRFRSPDGKQLASFARSGFSFSRLQPYQNWEQLFGEATRLWRIHVEVAKPLEVQRIGLRFINRIEMQQGDLHCEDYIKLHPEPTEALGLPFVGFFHQDTLNVPGHPLVINVIRTIQPPLSPSDGPAVILDIDVFTTESLRQEDLAQRLHEMRWLKNKVFYGNITDKALNTFK